MADRSALQHVTRHVRLMAAVQAAAMLGPQKCNQVTIVEPTASVNLNSSHCKFSVVIPCVFLQSLHQPTKELDKIQFLTITKTPTCFGTVVPSSGSCRTKEC